MTLTIREHDFHWGQRTYLMGILNLTPDSFSDGGQFNNLQSAIAQVTYMIDNGADIIDIGGQSTRPGASQISVSEEFNRVIPVIKAIREQFSIPISIDTTRAQIAQDAITAGADLINDISGGTFDPEMFPVAARLDVPIILMHMRGTPQTMQQMTDYQDLVSDIMESLNCQIQKAIACGVNASKIIIDPGIGFAKNLEQNLELLRRLSELKSLKVPILVGTSRKSFIGKIINQPEPQKRVWGTAATCCSAIISGADILRIHDVAEIYDVSRVADAIYR
ncbi:dihydropteroate synthase [Xenococcus sp. PCC 7305]|uniref:dihydropteroate synthase n=1 Tax=Xenococcus sp. PCC 7305 TaxID=102125 RepID=UPI0002ABD347|nr:dihydropteroate synthase [Xenococcus sp. PCC 7305]ELS03185.1 dihydropteroate synthase [Xenococcus sp. PCC 7305]